jgi:PHD/YefM family antitoxin component YafN of YafNO toxin-antitoxin module
MAMKEFTSADVQQKSGDIQSSAARAPVLILSYGKPRSVMVSVEEFRRLKKAAGEAVPIETSKRRKIVRSGVLRDPMGYDTTDIRKVALEMADAALSGRNRDAVRAEIRAVDRRLGLATGASPAHPGVRGRPAF